MIALIQRVRRAEVRVVDGESERVTGAIDAGLLALVCAERGDTEAAADKLLARVLGYRVFSDAAGKMNLSVQNVDGAGRAGGLLLVSQFTLAADTNSGLRPTKASACSITSSRPRARSIRWSRPASSARTCRCRSSTTGRSRSGCRPTHKWVSARAHARRLRACSIEACSGAQPPQLRRGRRFLRQ